MSSLNQLHDGHDDLHAEPAHVEMSSSLYAISPDAPKDIDARHAHDMKDILPRSFRGQTSTIEVPEYGFMPDRWSKAFLRGLDSLAQDGEFAGKVLMEPGIGTGINVGHLGSLEERKLPKEIWGGDLNARMAPVAARNVDRMLTSEQRKIVSVCCGSLSLIAWAEKMGVRPDVVYGCIPQVKKPTGVSLQNGDAMSHYFEVDPHDDDTHDFGLTLQKLLLAQARDLLAPKGKVVLNLGGRPGREVLEKMFVDGGFSPEVVHAELIRHHEGTDLHELVRDELVLQETTGHRYEFFSDDQGKNRIDATEAERLREEGRPVYHNIYVIQGTLS